MVALTSVIERYQARFEASCGARLSTHQRHALNAIRACRSGHYGEVQWQCDSCGTEQRCPHSCGHRNCHRCQNYETTRWLERQSAKLLPVEYFMVTFTLPYELRALAQRYPLVVYGALFQCAHSTLQTFAANDHTMGPHSGMSAVLHTHSRRLDHHPHVHIVLPAGCLDRQRKQWRKRRGKYLFNEFALARVFRARLLATLRNDGLPMPDVLPQSWVVDCRHVGNGLPALQYLSRYLYRGVINEDNIVHDDGTHVTFRYRDGQSGEYRTRRVTGETFLFLVFQHVLPKGFRRVRDYGLLHGNAKATLRLIQLVLQALTARVKPAWRPTLKCPQCKNPMVIAGFIRPAWRSG